MSANDELLTDFEEELQRYEANVRARRREAAAARTAAADPTVDLTADAHDGFSGGYGVRHGSGREAAATGAAGAQAADLAQELNTHAAAVLDDGGAPGAEPGTLEAGRQEMHKRALSGLEDLRPPQVPSPSVAAISACGEAALVYHLRVCYPCYSWVCAVTSLRNPVCSSDGSSA